MKRRSFFRSILGVVAGIVVTPKDFIAALQKEGEARTAWWTLALV